MRMCVRVRVCIYMCVCVRVRVYGCTCVCVCVLFISLCTLHESTKGLILVASTIMFSKVYNAQDS